MESAILAAGCFWGVQYYFDQVPGVVETEVGYIGGKTDNPTYEQVCGHKTGHAEATKITFDPKKVSYETLLKHFFRIHDPTQLNRQGPDVGDQYRSAIFYLNDKQKKAAQKMIDEFNKPAPPKNLSGAVGNRIAERQVFGPGSSKFDKPVVTTLEKADKFWPAEQYHQKYTERTGLGMCHVEYAPA